MRLMVLVWLVVFALLSGTSFSSVAQADEVVYVPLQPAFVTNYGGPGRLKYLKVDITLMVSAPRAQQALELHMPLVRNTIVLSLARQTDNNVSSTSGQERIRRQLLQDLQETLERNLEHPIVDEVLFTNFIYQN